jgi:hypothetical protein
MTNSGWLSGLKVGHWSTVSNGFDECSHPSDTASLSFPSELPLEAVGEALRIKG